MRNLIIAILMYGCANAFAYDHSYSVSGLSGNGESYEGKIYSTNGEKNVTGEVTDEKGQEHDFDGEWDGYKRIIGETDDGEELELDTD